jgi:hypothetical protein
LNELPFEESKALQGRKCDVMIDVLMKDGSVTFSAKIETKNKTIIGTELELICIMQDAVRQSQILKEST